MLRYELTKKASSDNPALGEQPFEVFDAIEKAKRPITVSEIADVIRPKIKTVQTAERVARWYCKIFVDRGWVKESVSNDRKPAAAKPVAKKRAAKPKPAVLPTEQTEAMLESLGA